MKRGRLIRQVQIRVLDLSQSGCLFQAAQPIEAGSAGVLQLDVAGTRCRQGLFVVRTSARPGTHASHFGAQFSPEISPARPSMREIVETVTARAAIAS